MAEAKTAIRLPDTQRLVDHIVARFQPRKIILFGSYAYGTPTVDSDLDLLVIEKRVENPRERTVRIRSALASFGLPMDIIVMASERFEETKNVIGGIAYPANKYGKVIYEAA